MPASDGILELRKSVRMVVVSDILDHQRQISAQIYGGLLASSCGVWHETDVAARLDPSTGDQMSRLPP
jgi:hypothetical protein